MAAVKEADFSPRRWIVNLSNVLNDLKRMMKGTHSTDGRTSALFDLQTLQYHHISNNRYHHYFFFQIIFPPPPPPPPVIFISIVHVTDSCIIAATETGVSSPRFCEELCVPRPYDDTAAISTVSCVSPLRFTTPGRQHRLPPPVRSRHRSRYSRGGRAFKTE